MWSTRARLAGIFAGLLFVTLVAFSLAIYLLRVKSAEQDLSARATRGATRVLRTMLGAERSGSRLTFRDSTWQATLGNKSAATAGAGDSAWVVTVSPTATLRHTLEPLPGFFLVLNQHHRLLYSSVGMRQLSDAEQDAITRHAIDLEPGFSVRATLPRDTTLGGLLLVARGDSGLVPSVSKVVYALPMSDAQVPGELLFGTLLLIAPLMLLAAVAAAYMIAGNTFKPVDTLINEVEAITDGRSLHRRVTTEEVDEELARLAETLNRMIERLQTSFGALRRFTADASHELKTPLTVVRADVERAMHPSASADERMQALEEAMQEVARMSDLVDSLLTLARADEGRFDLHREPIHLEALVRDVHETALILGEGANVSVTLPLVEDAVVMGDSTRLRQLFLNLITNAIKYTPSGGQVEITLSLRNNNEVGLAVRDTGVGIAAADLPNIFDRFWRADKARSRKAAADIRGVTERGGFGLGLAIAQWIAHAHGGTLTAQSRLGRGSIFTVLLPIAPADVTAEAGSA